MASHTEAKKIPNGVKAIIGLVLLIVGAAVLPKSVLHLPGGLEINFGEVIATIGILLLLFPAIETFYTGPLAAAIGERNSNLEKTFSEAEELRNQMDKVRSDYERRLAQTEAEAREKIQAQIKEAQALRQRLEADAVGRADELIKRAHDEIEADRAKLKVELSSHVVNLTLSATEKLLGENMDTEKNRRLVEEFITKVEVPH
jgi:F-type H+-transporting ATPase subunit b